ncbi:MAG TPA: hypothetical protein VJ998_08635 [Pseudomonadales bacterium]|nr:hypothetical protein [Pseudomonadales bacterium]
MGISQVDLNSLIEIGVALVVGLVLGYLIGARGKAEEAQQSVSKPIGDPKKEWWKLRDTLTGTQLQILQYMEAKKHATIGTLQEKFSFIPDRELFYRLEQIVLMGFIQRDRKHDEVVYALNADYAGRVEDDKTVIMPQE